MSTEEENRFEKLQSSYDYHQLVASGMAWEFYPELETSWEAFRKAQVAYFVDIELAKARAAFEAKNQPNLGELPNAEESRD